MSAKYSISNYFGDKLTINENTIELKIKKGGFWSGAPMSSMWGGYKPVGGNPDNSTLLQDRHLPTGKYSIQITEIKSFSIHNAMLHISVDNSDKDISEIYRCKKYYRFFLPTKWATSKEWVSEAEAKTTLRKYLDLIVKNNRKKIAEEKESYLDYEKAIEIYKDIGLNKEATRVRKLEAEQGAVKVDQTVVHGDYVDDRDTIVKDSVINRSNVGGKSSKAEELREAKSLLDEGLINEDDYEKMKKEILGK